MGGGLEGVRLSLIALLSLGDKTRSRMGNCVPLYAGPVAWMGKSKPYMVGGV